MAYAYVNLSLIINNQINQVMMVDKINEKDGLANVVQGHKICQSHEAKWLYLKNIYDHFQRPNFYDIGGTYTEQEADFWFTYKTEVVSKLYILHLFICNRKSGSFSVSVCINNELNIDSRTNYIKIDSLSKQYDFTNIKEASYNYLTTYSFSEFDVQMMKNKVLLIAITLSTTIQKQISIDHGKSLHNFGQLMSDPVGADFTIESADGAKFPVHKVLLAARSEVFKAMLKDDTAESINNVVKIDDVEKEDLSLFIEFIYTGTIKDVENQNCINLLMLGDRYDIEGLKDLAQHALAQRMNSDNALEILMVGDLYNAGSLKNAAFKYIKSNVSTLENSMFEEINNIQLIQDLCKYLALKC